MTDALSHRIVAQRRGGPEVLHWQSAPVPRPGAGEVLVRTLAAGVSGYDLMIRAHRFPGDPKGPFTPGVDLVGEVVELGPGVAGPLIGQRVAVGPRITGGCYTEHLCVAADDVVALPEGVDPVAATCVVTNYLTAHHVLHDSARARSRERVLIQGAAGGVGSAALDLARHTGLISYGTARPANHAVVEQYGATPIDYHSDVAATIRDRTAGGVDIVVDPVGGFSQLRRSYAALRPGGRLVWFGVAASKRSGLRVIPESLLARFALGVLPGKHVLTPKDQPRAQQRAAIAELLALLATGTIVPLIAGRIPLADAAQAHEQLQQGGVAGKLVLVADGPAGGAGMQP